jgi:hypothetical protein
MPKVIEWPQPKQLIDLLPPRPQRKALQELRRPDAEEQARIRELIDKGLPE